MRKIELRSNDQTGSDLYIDGEFIEHLGFRRSSRDNVMTALTDWVNNPKLTARLSYQELGVIIIWHDVTEGP